MIFFEGVPLTSGEREAVLSVLILFVPFTLWVYIFRSIVSLLFIRPVKVAEFFFKSSIILYALIVMYGNIHLFFGLSEQQSDLFYRISNYLLIIVLLIRHVSPVFFSGRKSPMNPMRLFVISFLVIISLGAGLLMLPEATTSPITFTQALFTSTSAVCVTGLVVLDTAKDFTIFGQSIILFLIQIGGLGIMSFTSFFVILARGEGSIHSRMALKDLVNHKQFGKIINILYGILLMTLLFEVIGAVLIYFSTSGLFETESSHLFSSIFHSVSAFCNAGFSTIPGGLANSSFSFNYFFLFTICFLIITGGLGFFIVATAANSLSRSLLFNKLRKRNDIRYQPGMFHEINFRLVVRTTLFLLLGGTILMYLLEYNGLHSGMNEADKWLASFFSAVTARTAGFNTLDYSNLRVPSLLLMIGLMWIGGSPGSTAGGIKTTTFALAAKNFGALIGNKKHVTIGYKRISEETLRKVSAIIFSSVILIVSGTFLLSIFEPQIPLQALLFEYVSALGTVGLSMNVTPELSIPSQYVIIITMFIGRLGLISILLAFVRKRKQADYYCPETTIFIN